MISIESLNSFNDTIYIQNYLYVNLRKKLGRKYTYDKLSDQPNVSIIVTADHETGDLQLAESIENIDNDLFLTTEHTSKNVKYYIYQKDNEDISKIPETIDNTNIFHICTALLNLNK